MQPRGKGIRSFAWPSDHKRGAVPTLDRMLKNGPSGKGRGGCGFGGRRPLDTSFVRKGERKRHDHAENRRGRSARGIRDRLPQNPHPPRPTAKGLHPVLARMTLKNPVRWTFSNSLSGVAPSKPV
ncbi:MAG: hypothetical protein Kow0092_05880 [Deferrisomatales bacterium]